MAQIQPPETFDFSTPNEWPKWRKRFERYLVVSGMKKKEEADKIDLFMYLMGDRADDIFRTFKFEKEEEATKIDSVLKAFDSHFCVRKNIIYERAKFNSRIQEDREPVDEFITSLYKLADSCEFEGLHEQLIRDRLVVGVRDKALSEIMQLDSELTLEKAVKMVRQQEAVRQQQVDLQRPSPSQKVNQVKFNSKKQSPKQQQQPSRKKEKSAKTRSRCPKCGGFTHREGQACRAEGQKCNLCSKTGHFANCCPDKQAKTAEVKAVSELDEEICFLLEVSAVEDSSNLDDEGKRRRRWTAEIQVNGKQVKFKLDSQADVTCVPLCLFKKIMGQQRLVKSDINLRAAEFSELQTVGMFISTLRNGNYEIKEKIYVIRRLSEPLLSRRACELLNLARRIEVVATRINPIKEFPEVFEGLGQIGNPYEIKLKPGAKPYAVHTPRRVPIPLMEKLKTRLEELEKAGIIAKVNVATEWCAPTVIAGKPNGDIRLCVDLSRLNEHVQREVHPMPVVEHMLGQLGEARFFSKLDANSGFHQIPLSPDCQHLTTFITPFGRYKYCRMPFGISLAPEYFQKVMSIILQGMDGVMCYLDDILIFASDSKTHDRILRLVLRKLKEAKVTLNKAKCVFGVPRINFLGHILDEDGIRPDPAKIEAVAKMPAPTDVHGVRRFIGMVNHLGRFVENLSEIVAPLNQLLVKGQDFVWDCSQERAFRKLKELLTTQPILAAYDVRKPTMVSSDASSYGLGAVLKQEGKNGIWRPVAYSSRTMTPTEKRYAQIEKEALAITWACERFQDFLLGKRFRIETDHKPLIPLFSTKELSSLTPRLQRFRMRMMRFGFEIVHIPGKELLDADALSRQPLLTTEGGEDERPTSAHINAVLSSITDKDEMLTKIFEAQQEDTTLKAVVNYLEQGWPDKKKMSQALLSYWHVKDELGVQNGLLMRGCRLVIPASMKLEILDKLHAGHFGITKTRLRARETVWWPGISEEIAETVRKCSVCIQEAVSKHEPLIPTNFPTRPWQKIGMDLFKFENKWYLVVIDYYSRFPEMVQLDRLTASVVVRSCKSIFARHGIPETVVSDNGTQFGAAREFANFARQYGFTHVTSSPRFPQSNGMAEAGVKIAKLILKKNQDPSLGLLEYRSTPLENGYSPAELLMGRKLRTTLPIAPENLNPKLVDSQALKRKEGRRRKDMKSRYDRRCGATDMEELSEGDTVWITDMRTWGIVKQKASTPRSYMIDTPVGTLRRNRFHLRKGYTVQYPADPSAPTFSGEELVENEKTPVVDYPSNDSEDGQIRTRMTTKTRKLLRRKIPRPLQKPRVQQDAEHLLELDFEWSTSCQEQILDSGNAGNNWFEWCTCLKNRFKWCTCCQEHIWEVKCYQEQIWTVYTLSRTYLGSGNAAKNRFRQLLAVSQDKDLHGGMIPIEVAEMEVDLSTIKDSTKNCLNSGMSDGHANSFVKNGGYVNPAAAKSENWAEQVEAAEKDNNTEPFESVHRKKGNVLTLKVSGPRLNTRQQQALNKARSEATSFDQCCYVEWGADFHHVHYMKALEELLGKDSVYQLMKKSGHAMVALASIEKAERLVENGLTINNTFLRAFPYRRKAEKIILGNLPIAVREEDIIEALRPYCRVVSLAYEVVSCNGYTWTTGNREAFVLLNEGRKLHQLPAKLVIISKGESTPAYVTYGVRCSRCHRQGHRRATCPQGTRSGSVLTPPPSLPTPSHSFTATTSAEGNSGTIQTIHVTPPNPAASSPAESCPVLSQNTPATKPSTPAPSTSVLPSLLAPSSTITSPTADPAKDQAKTALTMGSSVPKPQTTQLPQLTLQKVEDLFKVLDADSFLEPLYMDYHRWEIEKAVVCPTMREDVFTYLSPEQISALKKFLDKAIAHVGDKDSDLGKRLSDFRTECDIERDESPWPRKKKQAYANWAERVEASEKQSALESDWKFPKSNKRKGQESPTQPTKMAKAEAIAARPSLQPRQERKDTVTQIKSSRQQQELAKARSAAAKFDQGCFIEWCPDFHQVQYMKALEQMMGKSSVYQLMKMSGHVLVTLSSTEKVEGLIEEGLTIGSTLLRAFPYRKKAEKITIGNLPIAVKDEDIVAALRPYCKVASMAYEVVTCEGYTWTTGSREAFVLLNEGRKLHQLPAKLVIISKGESTPAYITYGVRCSKCHRQGHRRATCPLGTPQSRPAHLQDNQNGLLSTILSSQPKSLQKSAAPTSAALGPDTTRQTPSGPSSPATSLPVANLSNPPQVTPVTEPSASAPNANRLTPLQPPSSASSQKSSVNTPAPAPTITTAAPPPAASDHPAPEAAPVQMTLTPTAHKDKTPEPAPSTSIPESSNAQTERPPRYAEDMVEELLYKLNSRSFLRPLYIQTEMVARAVFYSQEKEEVLVSLTPDERNILAELLGRAIASIGDSDHYITQKLSEFKIQPPETFDFSTPNEWPKWRKRFERYLVVSGMKKREEADKIDLFMYLMGDRADDIFRTFKFEKEEEATKIDSVLKAFDSHFCVRKNIIYERAKFNSRIQEDREPVDEFITSLYKLADSCEFEGLHEQLIRDRIVVGVRDKALSERMQLDSELTLEKAVKLVRQQEAVRQQQVDLQRPSASQKVNQLKFNSKKQSPKQQQQPSRKKEKSAKTRSRCPKCGGFTHREGQACRAEGQKCNLCSKTGHFANCCPDKQAKTAEVKAVSELDEEIGFLLEVSAVEDSSNLDDDEGECRRRWTAEIQVNGKKVKFKLDSQADVTCVPLCLFKKIMGQQRLVKSDINLRAAEFSELQTVGMFISTLRNGNYEIKEKIYVIRRLSEPLLSRRACELLNLARRIEVVATRINPIKEFPEVFEGLGQIGNPYEIKLKPGAKPYAVHTPRRVPIPLMEKLKTRLEELEKAGIIAQVNVATEWCAPTVIAGKPNGDIRLCVDLSRLNEHVQREVHPMPVVEHMLGQLGEARFFSKLDANSGFHQIPLSPDCQHLTTFITPFGRYKYCRMPFGISLAPEYFQRVMSIILQGMDGVMCYLDDILIFASDSKTHDRILRLVLRKLKEAKVTLNKAKCVFGVPRINFLGHILDEDGIRPDPAKIEAVAKMPAPTDVHGVRFLGMVNHLGRFVENLSEIVAPLNQLLVKGQDFVWDCSQERAFRKLKELLTTQPILAAYYVRKPTMVSSDAYSYGLGAVLKQEGKNGIWRPVAYSSRTMTPTEKRYAQIEKEALAITWACEGFQDFLLGKRFRIETDHKPLIPLFSTKELSSLTPRLQRFRMRMMRFGFEIVHIPGKELLDADALSRQPLLTTEGGEDERPTSAHINAVLSYTTLKAVVNYLEQGWPDKKKIAQALLSYWHVKDELGVQNGLLMRSCRLVIPASMKLEILDKLHAGHFGITKTRLRARETVWWPGISEEIAETIGMDLFKFENKWYLVVIDYYSRFPEVVQLDRLTANVVVRSCKSIFSRHGIPETVVNDNGTQFGAAREFANFARQYGFTHVTSIDPQEKSRPIAWTPGYRSTPLENGYSPAELLMGRKLRTTLPIAPENLNPRLVDSQTLKRKEGRRRKDMKSRYDRRCGATDMEELSEGDTVWITDMRTWGIVKQKASTPRSYMVDTPVGTLRRNRFHLRKGVTVQYPADPSTPTFSGEELVENEKTPVVDYPSNDSEDGQIRTRSGRIVKPRERERKAVRPRGARAPRFREIEMEAMEISNMFSRLAESQDDVKDDGGTPTQKKPTNAEKSAEEVSKLDLKNAFLIKQTNGDYVNQAAEKKQAYANWAERVEASEKQSALESDWKFPKSNKRKGQESPTQPTKMAKAEAIAARPSLQPRQERKDTGCFIEWCPDFHQVQYMKALEQMMGKSSVYQLMKMSGHVLVTLSSTEKVERLIEEGLTIGSTLLRAFPYRKKAEKITIGNLPIAVKDEDIVAALRPYCKVASMAYEVVTCEGYTWTTGSREAFVLLNEGRKLHQLPAKLVIISKGESTPAYITYGVKCSKCHRQGHRRATCPLGTPQSRPAHLQDNQNGLLSTILSSQPKSLQKSAAPTSAALGPDTTRQTPSGPSSPATSLPVANLSNPPQVTPVTEPSASAPNANRLTPLQPPSSASSQKSSVNTPAPAPTITTAAPPPAVSDHPAPEAAPVQRTLIPTVHKDKTPETAPSTSIPRYAVDMVEELFYKLDSRSVLRPLDYETETAVWAVFSSETREDVLVSLTPEEKIILAELLDRAIASIGDSDHYITQKLSDFKVACEA
ncbi:K02A2.6-like [Cordylochernes scorpioides]|uniref:RNA-directed DNA polymerase n=1 Tax=Cordylochernes scorpioides TaxID=51811 RepID=A0ABY6KKJ4_9ARAC|nr:K02A2.6-like [Cordylochernes scorpioides]